MYLRLAILYLNVKWCLTNGDTDSDSRMPQGYQDEWVVRVVGGPQVASLLALQSGYRQLGPMLGFEDTYLWHKEGRPNQEKRGHPRLTKTLDSHAKIVWAEQQRVIHRHRRDHISLTDPESERPLIREKRLPAVFGRPEFGMKDQNGNETEENVDQESRESEKRDKTSTVKNSPKRRKRWLEDPDGPRMFNDELWSQEWYLQDTRTSRDLPKLDLNVLPLYRLGVTGRGVRIAVLDDGLEYTHDDLRSNYDAEISYDVNNGDPDPIPRYEPTGINGHGTRCAGEIAMEANNGKCGVGVAFGASIGGIKLLDGVVNDRVEGEALGYRTDLVDVYTASWGPADDGRSLEAPGRLAAEALHRGITQGRGGKGSIYVWASGNGGSRADDCGCDGYVGSIYTVAVGSASQTGRFPWYGERCPANLATTYSSGAYHDQMIATTDLRNKCTTRHTGTSASAPLAAGILALALQVNDDLTWRDVQHLIVWTSEYSPLSENPGWFKNSAGFWFNPRFGYGLMNAHALVVAGNNWTVVPKKSICEVKPTYISGNTLVHGKPVILEFTTGGCEGTENEIRYLEHVQIETNVRYTIRGALEMHLVAPSGTKVQILSPRKLDDSNDGFVNWKFMSVASWGEDPNGTWSLEIMDKVGPEHNNGTVGDITLILHGTKEIPHYMRNGPRIYNNEYNRIRKMNEVALVEDPSNVLDETQNWKVFPEVRKLERGFEKRWLKYFLST